MKIRFTKILFIAITLLIIIGCNITKRVANDKRLLTQYNVEVNRKKTANEDALAQVTQKPNSDVLGYRLRLNLYNLAKPNKDSLYQDWLNKNPKTNRFLTALLSKKQVDRLGQSFLVSGIGKLFKTVGEAPVIVDDNSTKKSLKRLRAYYYNEGYFDVTGTFETDTTQAKIAKVKYNLQLGDAYILNTITKKIDTPALDSLYEKSKEKSLIVANKQFKNANFENERNRLTTYFRNNGAYYFQSNYITCDIDTINTNKKVNAKIIIKNYNYNTQNDSIKTVPFKIYKINKVRIFTDYTANKYDIYKPKDSTTYRKFTLYSKEKLKYKAKAITNAIFINPGSIYSDENTTLTSKYLSNLKVFNYPTIIYKEDPNDANVLNTDIYLSPRKKITYNSGFDFTHSNIQDFGIAGNATVGIRNVFNGTETFEIGLRANIGSSKDLVNPYNRFFNILEYGIDAKLNFPRIFFPINTSKFIKKRMIPSTTISGGFAKQENIGLDKQNLTASFAYNWKPKATTSARFELFNIQFVKNLNTENYFNIYNSSYNSLNILAQQYGTDAANVDGSGNLTIPNGVEGFLHNVFTSTTTTTISEADFKNILSIEERRRRLTDNNLIFASNFNYTKTTQENTTDNTFHSYKFKIESAGNFLSLLAKTSKELKTQSGSNTFFDVAYSQYIKGEVEYIKHFDFRANKVLAIRFFGGLAMPYGNSKSIPFSRSYFSGGSNDNRSWQPYSLGPGSTKSIFDFNEANMKLALNSEFRFPIFGKFRGAVFSDIGNIWNIWDNVENKDAQFKGIDSLKEIAVGSGLGFRYDQSLFVIRFDLGFKTYNPALLENTRWFRELNLSKAVLNIGINYPF